MANQPLAGKTILVTRAKEQASELVQEIEAFGGQALELPLISFEKTDFAEHRDDIFQTIDSFDWLVFTSVNGVRFFMETFREKVNLANVDFPCIAAVGEKTAA